jgi:hypothetical protein
LDVPHGALRCWWQHRSTVGLFVDEGTGDGRRGGGTGDGRRGTGEEDDDDVHDDDDSSDGGAGDQQQSSDR